MIEVASSATAEVFVEPGEYVADDKLSDVAGGTPRRTPPRRGPFSTASLAHGATSSSSTRAPRSMSAGWPPASATGSSGPPR